MVELVWYGIYSSMIISLNPSKIIDEVQIPLRLLMSYTSLQFNSCEYPLKIGTTWKVVGAINPKLIEHFKKILKGGLVYLVLYLLLNDHGVYW